MEGSITIRIQLGAMPNMLGEAVEGLVSAYPELRVVGRCHIDDDPVAAARAAEADVLVMYDDDPALSPFAGLDDLDLFALRADGREGELLRIQRRRIALDSDGLAQIRQLATSPRGSC